MARCPARSAQRLWPDVNGLGLYVLSGTARPEPGLVPLALLGDRSGVNRWPRRLSFRAECPQSYLVGLAGRTGEWVDRISPICAPWLRDHRRLDYPAVGPSFGAQRRRPRPSANLLEHRQQDPRYSIVVCRNGQITQSARAVC